MALTSVCLMPNLQVPYVGIRFNARDVLNASIWAVGLYIVLTSIIILCLALKKPSESIKLNKNRAIGAKRRTVSRELFNFTVAAASICLFIFPDLPTVFLDPALILAVIGYGMLAAFISIQLVQFIYDAIVKAHISSSSLVASRKVAALKGTLTKVFTFILIVGMGISVFQLRGQAVDAFTDYGAQKAQKMQNKVLQIRELFPGDRLDASITELINPAVGELYCIGISVKDDKEQLLLYTTDLRAGTANGEQPALIQEVLSEIGEGITNATKTQVFSSDNVIVFLVNEQGIDSTKLGAELLPQGLRVSELGRDYLVMVEMQKYFGYWHLLLGIVGVFPLLFGLLLPVTALIARSLGILELKEQLYYPKRFRFNVGVLVGIVPFLTIPGFIYVGYVVFGSVFQRRILTYPPLDYTVPLWVSVACVVVLLVCFLQIYWQPQPPQPQSPSAEASGKEIGSS